jgi:mannose/fructose/N-acetylgalactosamine-specific phosphotransferase system component IIC
MEVDIKCVNASQGVGAMRVRLFVTMYISIVLPAVTEINNEKITRNYYIVNVLLILNLYKIHAMSVTVDKTRTILYLYKNIPSHVIHMLNIIEVTKIPTNCFLGSKIIHG